MRTTSSTDTGRTGRSFNPTSGKYGEGVQRVAEVVEHVVTPAVNHGGFEDGVIQATRGTISSAAHLDS